MLVALALTTWLLPVAARADAIGPPPSRCPPGAIPESSHVGEYCYPGTCASNADCERGQICVQQPLCIEPMTGYSRGGPMTVDHVVTTCGPDGGCPPGAACQSELRCVSRASAVGGDGAAVPTAGVAIAIAVVLLLALVVLGVGGLVFALTRKKRRQERRSG
jgi:hypothetical protein